MFKFIDVSTLYRAVNVSGVTGHWHCTGCHWSLALQCMSVVTGTVVVSLVTGTVVNVTGHWHCSACHWSLAL